MADVIEMERDGISVGVALNKHGEGTEDNYVCKEVKIQTLCMFVHWNPFINLSIHEHAYVHVCLRIILEMGEGKRSLKPWNWMTAAFHPLEWWLCLCSVKKKKGRNTQETLTCSKHHYIQCCLLCHTHTSISQMYLLKLCALMLLIHNNNPQPLHSKNRQPQGGLSWEEKQSLQTHKASMPS